MPTIMLQAEFSLFPDNTVLGPTFTLSSFRFTDLGGSPSFVNVSGAVKGLQFPNAGVRLKLPAVTNRVTLRVAAFASDFNIVARNSAGVNILSRVVVGDNAPHTLTLIRPGMARLEFIGGQNEGVIISASMKITF